MLMHSIHFSIELIAISNVRLKFDMVIESNVCPIFRKKKPYHYVHGQFFLLNIPLNLEQS